MRAIAAYATALREAGLHADADRCFATFNWMKRGGHLTQSNDALKNDGRVKPQKSRYRRQSSKSKPNCAQLPRNVLAVMDDVEDISRIVGNSKDDKMPRLAYLSWRVVHMGLAVSNVIEAYCASPVAFPSDQWIARI